jgi:transcription antitermination factor NusG
VARARQVHGIAGNANRPWPRRMPPRGALADDAPPARAEPSPVDGIDAGSRVRVLAGPFTSKVGVVSELDGRGGARVLFGLLSTRVDVGDLEPAVGRVRPALAVSHRAAARKPR